MKRILDIVDAQHDFMHSKGKLSVTGAERLISLTDEFFRALKTGAFDLALFKYDTHFKDEYPKSPESQFFPDIHCEYGTEGWQLAVNSKLLEGKFPVRYMAKNTFDMWQQNPISDAAKLKFANDIEETAYANLYHVTSDVKTVRQGVLRDKFFTFMDLGQPDAVKVTLLGVASDFCDHDAMLGYLERGADVEVIEDLVAGIGSEIPGRSKTGDIRDVIALPVFEKYVRDGRLTLTNTQTVLARQP